MICKTDLTERLARIRLLAMDVDGVLTDGKIHYSSSGDELRSFHVSDGLGIVLVHMIGVEVAWITGRKSAAVERRAGELTVRWLRQGIHDKGAALQDLASNLHIKQSEIAYIGDDWNDLPAYSIAGVRIAVADGHADVRDCADAVTERGGGNGAVREVVDALIDAMDLRQTIHAKYFESLRTYSLGTGQ